MIEKSITQEFLESLILERNIRTIKGLCEAAGIPPSTFYRNCIDMDFAGCNIEAKRFNCNLLREKMLALRQEKCYEITEDDWALSTDARKQENYIKIYGTEAMRNALMHKPVLAVIGNKVERIDGKIDLDYLKI